MSMNLVFVVKGGGTVDFPFQTPTNLTYSVLGEKSKAKRLRMLDDAMKEWGWSKSFRAENIRKIEALMNNPVLKLGMI